MPLWLETTLTIAALLSVVPLAVLANTSSPKAAWRASKEYVLYLAILVVPGALFTLVYWLML
jgi:hypothetical protein